MKKRTKFELLIFAVVAVIFLMNLWGNRGSGNASPAETGASVTASAPAHIELPSDSKAESVSGTESQAETESVAALPVESTTEPAVTQVPPAEIGEEITVEEDGSYTDADHVALYIQTYGHLPSNYITKEKARAAGWDSQKGNLGQVLPGMSIGGDRFGNYEKLLPEKKGRKYYECDIDYNPRKKSRGKKRIVFSNDGLIYYTEDHYNTFTLLYGEES